MSQVERIGVSVDKKLSLPSQKAGLAASGCSD
jgi:hypothetical protein